VLHILLYLCHASSRFLINFTVALVIQFRFFDFCLTVLLLGMWLSAITPLKL